MLPMTRPITISPQLIVKFWVRVYKTESCWLWQSSKNKKGYGTLTVNGKTQRAHRIAWMLLRGPIPDDLFVLHLCATPACVRIEHLFLGTAKDNALDCIAKGRNHHNTNPGSYNGCAKLRLEDVIEMRRRYTEGASTRALARSFSMSKTQAWRVTSGQHWNLEEIERRKKWEDLMRL